MALEHVHYVMTSGVHKRLQLDAPKRLGADGIKRRPVSVDKLRLALAYLAYRADNKGETYVGYRRMADELGCSHATALEARKQLENLGYVVKAGMRGNSDNYRLNLPGLAEEVAAGGLDVQPTDTKPKRHRSKRDTSAAAPTASDMPPIAPPVHADRNGDPMPDNVRQNVRQLVSRPRPCHSVPVHDAVANYAAQLEPQAQPGSETP